MLQETISLISTFSIAIAAILGVLRFNSIEKSYYPFIYICWLGLIVEIIAFFSQKENNTFLPSNIYVLFEGLLFAWQFKKWGSFQKRPWIYIVIQVIISAFWIMDSLILHTIHKLSSGYRVAYSTLLVILAIDHLNKLIVRERKSFLKNAKFLICIVAIFFFCYKLTMETFYLYAVQRSKNFDVVIRIFSIQHYVNLFANLLYAYIVIWIPKKKIFLEPSR